MIKILKDKNLAVGTLHFCADGCCSWMEYQNEELMAGDEIQESKLHDFDKLIEGIDYIYVKD